MDPLTPAEAAHLLAREFRAPVDAVDVRRMVRHGQVPGEADGRGRVVVDGAGLRSLIAVTNAREYGRCEPMVELDGLGLDHERLAEALAQLRR